jgi:hypothetical protein
MSKNNQTSAAALLSFIPDTCQELRRMDQLLAELPGILSDTKKAAENEETSLKAIAIRATLDAPSLYWMLKGAPGYDGTYYKSVNTRVKDASFASGTFAKMETTDKNAQRVRDYAAEWVLEQQEAESIEIPVAISDKLQAMADRTPAGKWRLKQGNDNGEAGEGKSTRPDDVRAAEHILAAFKIAYKSEGPWTVKYIKALKGLISPDDIAQIETKADTAKAKTK